MKLSVIVPVYNIAGHLPHCMDSLLVQVSDDMEILLIDDGSDDGTSGQICDRYAAEYPGLVKAVHLPHSGCGTARNAGLIESAGEYILFIDGDDYVSPDMIRTLRPFMNGEWDIVIFGFRTDTDGVLRDPPPEDYPYGKPTSLSIDPQLLLNYPCVWNKLWRAELFRRGKIRFPTGIWYEDLAVSGLLMAEAESIIAIHDVLYYYVVREGSITHNTNAERNREIISAMEFLLAWYRRKGLLEAYRESLEAVAVKHVLLTASVRVVEIDPDSTVLAELLEYMRVNFPNWSKNRYVHHFPLKHRMLLLLLKGRHYRLLRKLFDMKSKLP